MRQRVEAPRAALKVVRGHMGWALIVLATLAVPSTVALLMMSQAGFAQGSSILQNQAPQSTPVPTQRSPQEAGASACTFTFTPPSTPTGRRIYYSQDAPDELSTVGVTFKARDTGLDTVCSGVIIADNTVLTAGHCACGRNGSYALWLGEKFPASALRIPVDSSRIVPFPGYDCKRAKENQPGRDYALIKFDPNSVGTPEERKKIYQVATVMPPLVAQRSVLDPGNSLLVVGYGKTEIETIGERRKAYVPVLSWMCADGFAEARMCEPFSELILSELASTGLPAKGRNKDTCGGDSGGPAFAQVATTDSCGRLVRQSYLVAITSRELGLRAGEKSDALPCGGGGVYEVVARASVRDWLRRNDVALTIQATAPGD